MIIIKYRVYFDSDHPELGYVEYLSSEGLDVYEIITEEISEGIIDE